MIIYGSRASNIGNFEVQGSVCDYCEQQSSQRISVFGKYAHIFWIPFFPIGKHAVSECVHCKRTIDQREFSPELKQLYRQQKSQSKRPWWHWFGLGALSLLIMSFVFIGETAEKDPRDQFLKADLESMRMVPSMEEDSVSFKLKQVFDAFINEEIEPGNFEYLTKTEGNKSLILVKIPSLKSVEKDERGEVLEMISMIVNNQEDLKDNAKYIGIHGKYNMMMTKTPGGEENSSIVSSSPLYDFYGPKPE